MPGSPATEPTDPYLIYPDQALLRKIERDLVHKFAYGWLEHWFDGYIDKTVEALITNGEAQRRNMAMTLAGEVTHYLTENKVI